MAVGLERKRRHADDDREGPNHSILRTFGTHVGAGGGRRSSALDGQNSMLNESDVKYISDKWELIFEKRFKKLRYTVEWLDTGKAKRMPEFLVCDGSGPVLVCEVKTVLAGKPSKEHNASISLMDDDLPDGATFDIELDKSKVDEDLQDASAKYVELLKKRNELKGIPLIVAFHFDFFAGDLSQYPGCMDNYPLVSGVVTLVKDREIKAWAHDMTLEELKRRIDENDHSGMPQNTAELKLVRNRNASNKLPRVFVEQCISE